MKDETGGVKDDLGWKANSSRNVNEGAQHKTVNKNFMTRQASGNNLLIYIYIFGLVLVQVRTP
jgi:hypothetical protein